jgi:hypothetical protein
MRLIARKGKFVCALLTVILSVSVFCSAVGPASRGQRLAAGLDDWPLLQQRPVFYYLFQSYHLLHSPRWSADS